MEELRIPIRSRYHRPHFLDQVLDVEVNPRAQSVRTRLDGKVPTVNSEQAVAVASSSREPLLTERPLARSRAFTPPPRAQHPDQSLRVSGPSGNGVAHAIGMSQEVLQEFMHERRENLERANVSHEAPLRPIPTETGRAPVVAGMMREQSLTPLPPLSTVLPARPVRTTMRAATAMPADSASALALALLHPAAAPPPPASPAAKTRQQTAQSTPSPPSSDSVSK